jgi:protease-4
MTMRRGRVLLLLLVLLLVAIVGGSVVAIVWLLRDGPGGGVDPGSLLVVELEGPLPEQPMPEQPLPGFGERFLSVFEVDRGLRRAAADEDVAGLLIRIGGLGAGWGKVEEMRAAIDAFRRDSGKPVDCFFEDAGNKEYFLATACSTIHMAPEGLLLVNGLRVGVTFWKGALDKLGVQAEFTRAGKYKSAVEPYTNTEMSAPTREMMNALADSLFSRLVSEIGARRGLTEERVRALIDDPPMTGADALATGLVDALSYRDQLFDRIVGAEPQPMFIEGDDDSAAETTDGDGGAAAQAGDDDSARAAKPGDDDSADAVAAAAGRSALPAVVGGSGDDDSGDDDSAAPARAEFAKDGRGEPERISLGEYLTRTSTALRGPEVAVVFCEGQIMTGPSQRGGFGGETMGSDTIAAAIRKARRDEDVKAIVLRVDSPGGSGLASDIIWREVELARKVDKKPVVVSMSDLAASGGYYISMDADAIVAHPTTLTGSIGVFAGKMSLGGLYAKIGLTTDSLQRGQLAGLFDPSEPLGERGLAKLQGYVDHFYGTFLDKADAGRALTREQIHEYAQGRVWSGADAKAIGLVDELGPFETALAIAKSKAGLDGPVKLTLLPHRATFWEELMERAEPSVAELAAPWHGEAATAAALRAEAPLRAISDLVRAAPLLASGEAIAMPPFVLDVQ